MAFSFFHPAQVLFATGDTMAQQAVERVGVDKHDYARTGRMALYGGGALHRSLLSHRARSFQA